MAESQETGLTFEAYIDQLLPPAAVTQQVTAAEWLKAGAEPYLRRTQDDTLWNSVILWSTHEPDRRLLRNGLSVAAEQVITQSTLFCAAVQAHPLAVIDPYLARRNETKYQFEKQRALTDLIVAAKGLHRLITNGSFIIPGLSPHDGITIQS